MKLSSKYKFLEPYTMAKNAKNDLLLGLSKSQPC